MRKALGVVRALDSLGRFVIPSELRKSMGLLPTGHVDIYISDDRRDVILQVLPPDPTGCAFCSRTESALPFYKLHDKLVCHSCRAQLADSKPER